MVDLLECRHYYTSPIKGIRSRFTCLLDSILIDLKEELWRSFLEA
uniref:Uncharacterized protein n=1 Tax=Arabidopsis thaliana TaxID=3702 RepID=Q570D8_ARATH|nr:hypothetical protein [Arabidopsis thaliana]